MTASIFSDLAANTTSAVLNDGRKMQQHVSPQTFLMKYLMKGTDGIELLQGGMNIRSDHYLKSVSTYRDFRPGQKVTPSNPQISNKSIAHWRYAYDEMSYDLSEIILQGSSMTPGQQIDYYVGTIDKVSARSALSFITGMEDGLHALPDFAEMEKETGILPNSLAVFVNEMGDGMYASYRSANGGNNEVLGVSPIEFPNWKNPVGSYDHVGLYAAGTHLFAGLDNLFNATNFENPPTAYGEMFNENAYGFKVIGTQREGLDQYQDALRVNNDHTRAGPQDPSYSSPLYNGVPVRHIAGLDAAKIYPTTGAADPYVASPTETSYSTYDDTSNAAVNNAGARYHLWNFESTRKVFHQDRYFDKQAIRRPDNQLETMVQNVISYHNNTCVARRNQAILRPSANI